MGVWELLPRLMIFAVLVAGWVAWWEGSWVHPGGMASDLALLSLSFKEAARAAVGAVASLLSLGAEAPVQLQGDSAGGRKSAEL